MPPPADLARLAAVIKQHWGLADFRPLQAPAMRAVLEGRDSLLVLPTGGGKSLCYQAPAVLRGDTTVVISPLIALMKDQVDRLRANGIPAAALNSTTSSDERTAAERALLQGRLRLVFVSPERLASSSLQLLLRRAPVGALAVDEAHCISQWGHDFRPEYRQLDALRALVPTASVHAYTATATEQVRRDIIEQLGLRDPEVLIGNFDRPNLTYRVVRRGDVNGQIQEVLARHRGEAGIIYCITRKDVDELATLLRRSGARALPYHAGLADEQRQRAQDAFMREECDVIVATVAFGMGIDRSNVRFVLHRGMPKSLDHYQQEAGRAGRDGLEAECILLYSDEDVGLWRFIFDKARENEGTPPEAFAIAQQHLEGIQRFCHGTVCRHRALVEYFGQTYPARACGACDLCLGDAAVVPDSTTLAQKLLSGVARVKDRFSAEHVTQVLLGQWTAEIAQEGHDKLTTFGLLQGQSEAQVRDWFGQLLAQGLLDADEATALGLNEASWAVLRGERPVKLVEPAVGRSARLSRLAVDGWEGVDRDLFEALRGVRQKLARERRLPPDVIFSDLTLREMARVQPGTLDQLRNLYGVGEAKLRELGAPFLQALLDHRRARQTRQAEAARQARAAVAARQHEHDEAAERDRDRGDDLLRGVLQAPDEDGPRLAYAEWLEQRGDLLSVARAELIRAQCALAGAPDAPNSAALAERVQELLRDYEMHWIDRLRQQARSWAFARGFIEQLTIEPEKLMVCGDEVFAAHPVRRLRLVGRDWVLKNLLASRHLARLASLDLSGLTVNRLALKALADSPHVAGLRELRLVDTGLDDEGARVLAGSRGLAGLTALVVERNPLTEVGQGALRARFGDMVVCC